MLDNNVSGVFPPGVVGRRTRAQRAEQRHEGSWNVAEATQWECDSHAEHHLPGAAAGPGASTGNSCTFSRQTNNKPTETYSGTTPGYTLFYKSRNNIGLFYKQNML